MKTKEETIAALKKLAYPPAVAGSMVEQLVALFEAERPEAVPDDPETYAIAAQVTLATSYGTAGLLSVEANGLLRMSQPGLAGDPNVRSRPPTPIMATHYFSVHNIVALVVVKPLKGAQPVASPIIVQ